MAWQTPKTNWKAADVVSKDDFNRIEGNAQHLKDTKVDETEFNLHANNENNPHNVTASQVGAAPSSHTHDNRYYTESEIDTKMAAKVNKPSSATSGNIAVFDGGANKIKDSGISATGLINIANYTESAFTKTPTQKGVWEDWNLNAEYGVPGNALAMIQISCTTGYTIRGGIRTNGSVVDRKAEFDEYGNGTWLVKTDSSGIVEIHASIRPTNFKLYYIGYIK